jgi:hypothetical protein
MEVIMSNAFIIRYETKPEAADENQRLVEGVFEDLAREDPGGISYMNFRLTDGVTFVHVVINESEANPLGDLPAFKEFQRELKDRVVPGSRVQEEVTLVGSYRFLDAVK